MAAEYEQVGADTARFQQRHVERYKETCVVIAVLRDGVLQQRTRVRDVISNGVKRGHGEILVVAVTVVAIR